PALRSDAPAISVVIPMYNVEKYVADCLNSLLVQTFQDFEVIVVDDCSTDNSVKIVKSYAKKFSGRLKLAQTKENSGGAGYVPRNTGFKLSRGEYIFFMDPDDFTLDNTLETLYNAARKYDTDVVYTSAHYRLDESNEFRYLLDGYGKELRNKGLPDEQALIVDNPDKNLQRLLLKDDFHMPFVKLVRRDFLIDNEISYPKIISSGDYIWTIHVYCCSKRFLRLPVPLYFYRQNPKSITEERRAPKEQLVRCVKALVLGLDSLTELSNKFDLLKQNSTYFRYAFMPFLRNCLRRTIEARNQLNSQEIYDILRSEFPDVDALEMFPFLFSIVADQAQRLTFSQENFESVLNSITARMDIKLTPQTKGGELQIISLSDKKADVRKPAWLQRDGSGYQIQSCEGDMDAVFKATADGQIRLNLMGLDVRDADDKSKRVPSWIDYTYLTINGKNIFSKITPAWHDKPYTHTFDVKAGDELKIQLQWLPHRKVIRESLAPTVSQKFLPHLTARLDMQLKPETAGGDFKIISVSDKKAAVWKPDWLQKEGVGYQIQSHNGSIDIVAKVTADGQIKMDFRGVDMRDKKDNSKRVPYWIDYTNLTINGKKILNKIVPACHDQPYRFTLNVKAGQEIKMRTEWSPHRDDVLIPSVITLQENVTPPVSKKFLPYLTSRLDIKLETIEGGDLQIVNMSDKKATIKKAAWL
ncbi:MAG: glycosyltransferase family 2 protein, partial [Selenomonadaceae bacterium]|nr:glycosyltransferase family 2 protein [Selenomonadaceae bacterium]